MIPNGFLAASTDADDLHEAITQAVRHRERFSGRDITDDARRLQAWPATTDKRVVTP